MSNRKTIVLLTRRNVGLIALSFLVAKGYRVRVLSDDKNVLWLAEMLGCEVLKELEGVEIYDLLLSVHWHKIVPQKYLVEGKAINIHPCLFLYKGKDPIARYIQNQDTFGSVEAHEMTMKVDEGKVVAGSFFKTGIVNTYQEFYDQAGFHYYKVIDKVLEYSL